MDETNTMHAEHPLKTPEDRAHLIFTRQIAIEGMTCDNCVRTVEKALRGQRGVKNVEVDRENAVATVTFDSSQTDIPALHDALLKSGYKPARVAKEE
jgi:copper chaperone CopZ